MRGSWPGAWQATWTVLPRLARARPAMAWQVASHKVGRLLVPVGAARRSRPARFDLLPTVRWARWLLAAQSLFYGAALAGSMLERSGRRNRWLYLPYYFCRMNLAGLSGALKVLAQNSGGVWERVPRG